MSSKLPILATSGAVIALALVAFFKIARHEVSARHASMNTGMHAAPAGDRSAAASELSRSSASTRASGDTSQNLPSTPAKVWATKFRTSDDFLKFVTEALPAAEKGDGRAAWYIGEALNSCALVMKTYHGSADPEAQLTYEVTNLPHAPQWTRDLLIQKTHRCLGLAQQDPFEHLPRVDGAYSARYWHEQALAHGDPLARVDRTARALNELSAAGHPSGRASKEELELVATNLRAVVESRDPDALFNAGILLADGRHSSTPLNGIAVALAHANWAGIARLTTQRTCFHAAD